MFLFADRCGVCGLAFPTPESSITVSWAVVVASELWSFDQVEFKRRMAAALEISPEQITLVVTAGSLNVESTFVSESGDLAGAASIASSINARLGSPAAATAALGVAVVSSSVPTTVSASPSFPPFPPQIPPPVQPPPPSTPPGVKPPEKTPTSFALMVLLILGPLAIVVAFCGQYMRQGGDTAPSSDYNKLPAPPLPSQATAGKLRFTL